MPQYGQRGSSELMSLRQLGQSIDCFGGLFMKTKKRPDCGRGRNPPVKVAAPQKAKRYP
jgi:hypothetical protein